MSDTLVHLNALRARDLPFEIRWAPLTKCWWVAFVSQKGEGEWRSGEHKPNMLAAIEYAAIMAKEEDG